MHLSSTRAPVCACTLWFAFGLLLTRPAVGQLKLGPEQLVQAGGAPITGTGYSVPSLAFWNNDSLPDLVVGEGPIGGTQGKARVYLNKGTPGNPQFASWPSSDSFYAQSNGADLAVTGGGCLGAFPRMWDANNRKDLLVGQSDGKVKLYHQNTGTDAAPTYDGGAFVQAGPAGSKADINVTARAACSQVDWNNDTKQDLLVGDGSGNVRVYVNGGSNAAPDFATGTYVQAAGSTLSVTSRASPAFADLDRDGLKDLLVGDYDGQLRFYKNTGSASSPVFAAATFVLKSDGTPLHLSGQLRSRPFVCDWDGNGQLDVLLGYGDGKVRLYTITPEPGTLCLAGAGLTLLLRRRRSPRSD